MWSFAMNGLAVLVLRYKQPGKREFRVPLNPKIAGLEIPVGLGLITLGILSICIINLFTKEVATIYGIGFTVVFFGIFTVSEKLTQRRARSNAGMDQFNLEFSE